MTLCRHETHRTINWILAPKYSTDEVLISTSSVSEHIEHYLLKFKQCNKYPDWYYFSGKDIRKCRTQPNGRGSVYVVPMHKRQDFIPLNKCAHAV